MSIPTPPLYLHNALSKQKELVTPIKAGELGIYVCGMTVYDYCHIGHARVMVSFDVLIRVLRHMGWTVNYVRNITDVDDKIIQRANQNNETIQVLTQRYIDAMHEDADALGCLRPDTSPKATEYIDEMQSMIGTLMDKKIAYQADNGDVYYSVNEFKEYGKLSGRKLEDMKAGARVDVDNAKQNPLDFVLWKTAKADEPHWQSPWGIGRPGWHIECSAMSTCCLGNHFDIHGGGGDLLFPHHENEIAQSEAATGQKYVNTWMHVGFVNVDGEKMSKSLGNFFTIRDVMKEFNAEVIRFFILSSHYRSPINFSDNALKDAYSSLKTLYTSIKLALDYIATTPSITEVSLVHNYTQKWQQALLDDINTPAAISVLFELSRDINKKVHEQDNPATVSALLACLIQLAEPLGILQKEADAFLKQGMSNKQDGFTEEAIETMISQRTLAKSQKDFSKADAIRKQLSDAGIVIEDSPQGVTWRRI